MSETIDHLNDLKEIRSLMERSSRFISLSGLSGVFAGIFALLGAGFAYILIEGLKNGRVWMSVEEIYIFLFLDAFIVLILAIGSGLFFTIRQTRKKGLRIWDSTSKRLIINMAVPLAVGGFFCLALLYYGVVGLIAPGTLIFYGLALLNGSNFTLNDIRNLGYCEIILGVFATIFTGYGILFWAMGFGVLHIVYGVVMYFKYEK